MPLSGILRAKRGGVAAPRNSRTTPSLRRVVAAFRPWRDMCVRERCLRDVIRNPDVFRDGLVPSGHLL